MSANSLVSKATLTSPSCTTLLLMKLGQTGVLEMVAVLKTSPSKSDIPTIQPAGASSISYRLQPPIRRKM